MVTRTWGRGELFSRMHCVGRPGVEVRHAAEAPQTWIAHSVACNDDFEKTEPEADLIDMEEKELTGVIDELNIGNAKKARLNCSMKLESC